METELSECIVAAPPRPGDERRRRSKPNWQEVSDEPGVCGGGHQDRHFGRRYVMDKTNEAKPKKKGFFATLKESMTKTSEGCGPGCGCHVEEKKEKTKGSEDAEKNEKT